MDATARGGEVQSDFTDIKIVSRDDQATASGNVGGGGPHLVLNNEHGTIEIRKASSADADNSGSSSPKTPKGSHIPQPTDN